MKIAFLNIYQGKIERGLETYVKELAKNLSVNHKVDILTDRSGSIRRWPVLWRFYLDPHGIKIALFTLRIIPKLLKEKYDVIFPLNGGWQPALIRLITWIFGGKVVISGQSGRGWDDRNNLWCFPDCFVSLSSSSFEWARKVNPFIDVKLIPNGVDTVLFNPKGNKYNTGLKKPIVICQGAAEPSKRIDLAIDAVAGLKNVSLLVVGTGSLEEKLKRKGQSLLGKRFGMIHVTHSEMPDVYRSADVFTLPSVATEAFGISIIEALATNLPVVVTDNGIRREIAADAGVYVDPVDTGNYSESISQALKKDWGEKPRRQAEKYSWQFVTKKYEELFSSLVDKK